MSPVTQQIMFWLLAVGSVAAAVLVVTGKNLFRTILFFGIFLLGIAGFFFLLEATFVAVTQIFVYVGGVVVMVLFGTMLTAQITETDVPQTNQQVGLSALASVLLVGLLGYVIIDALLPTTSNQAVSSPSEALGVSFLTTYLLPFEVISVLLLVAVVGAIIIAREDPAEAVGATIGTREGSIAAASAGKKGAVDMVDGEVV